MSPAGQLDSEIARATALPSIVTITAEPGVDAVGVGRLVAGHCGMGFVGAEAAESVAANTGLPIDVVAELLTRAAPDESQSSIFVSVPPKNYVVGELRRMITRIAAGRQVVIVCSGAAEVLAGEPRAVHVLLLGQEGHRGEKVAQGRFDLAVTIDAMRIEAAAQQITTFLRQPLGN